MRILPTKKLVTKVTYRVDVLLPTGGYTPYTSERGCGLGLATSLSDHLKRNGAGGRLVQLPSSMTMEEWERKVDVSPDTARDTIQAFRDVAQGRS